MHSPELSGGGAEEPGLSAGHVMQSIVELYQRSHSFPLAEYVPEPPGPPALPGDTLKFIGSVLQVYKPAWVLEFGSGFSTRFLTSVLRVYSPTAHLYTIDNSASYLQKVKDAIPDNQSVTFLHCPIKLYRFRWKTFATYDPAWVRCLPRDVTFDMVLIDGPPARRFGREAPLYQIAPFVTSETLILLDDANREQEREAIANWRRVFREGFEIELFSQLGNGVAVIRLTSPTRMAKFPFGLREILIQWRKALTAWRAEA